MSEHKTFYGIAEAVNTQQGTTYKYLPMNTFDPKSKGDAIFDSWIFPIIKINAACDRLPLDMTRVVQLEGVLIDHTEDELLTNKGAHLIVREEKLTRYGGGSETSASMWYRQEMSAKELAERIKQDKPRKSSEGLVELAHRVYRIQKAALTILQRNPEDYKIGYVFRQSKPTTAQMNLPLLQGMQGILETGEHIYPTQLVSSYDTSYQSQPSKSTLSPEKPGKPIKRKGKSDRGQFSLFPEKKGGSAKVIPLRREDGIICPGPGDAEVPF